MPAPGRPRNNHNDTSGSSWNITVRFSRETRKKAEIFVLNRQRSNPGYSFNDCATEAMVLLLKDVEIPREPTKEEVAEREAEVEFMIRFIAIKDRLQQMAGAGWERMSWRERIKMAENARGSEF